MCFGDVCVLHEEGSPEAIFSLLFSNLRPIISTDGMRLHAAVCEAGAITPPSW